jgi:hypothetical protein
MSKRVFVLRNEAVRRRCEKYAYECADGTKVTFSDPGKTREQEEKYHAQIGDIARQWKFCERLWDAEDMKRLCIDQFRRDTKDDATLTEAWKEMGVIDMAPSIDKTGVVALGVQSRKFPKVLGSAFVEWLYALGAEVGVVWTEPKDNHGKPT